jgi:hypothetical protein
MFKRARKIIVNNEIFYYKITGYVSLMVQRESTGVKKLFHREVKPKWRTQMKPSFVREFIEKNYYPTT